MEKKLINLCGFWQQKDKNGGTFLSGKLGFAKVLLFKNKYKDSENKPDWILYATEYEKKEDTPKQDPFDPIDENGFLKDSNDDDIQF